MKTLKKKRKTNKVALPNKCFCKSTEGVIDIEQDDGYKLFVLKCVCGAEFDHSVHKELLGAKV